MEADKKDEVIARLSMAVVYLTILIFILIITSLIFCFHTSFSAYRAKEPMLCGTYDQTPRSYNSSNLVGEKLFKQNCAVCHSLSTARITGPGLAGITARVPSGDWLSRYISNCDSVYKLKDPYALKLRHEFPESRMTIFSNTLLHSEIEKIISYIKESHTYILQ
jgi:hypothetical protein